MYFESLQILLNLTDKALAAAFSAPECAFTRIVSKNRTFLCIDWPTRQHETRALSIGIPSEFSTVILRPMMTLPFNVKSSLRLSVHRLAVNTSGCAER